MTRTHNSADLFHIGPPKTATTWFYYCLKEHPEICAPPSDGIHYYDMLHGYGSEWYAEHFAHEKPNQKRFDPTYTTISSARAAKRIHQDNPNAKLSFVLRNPIDRAFSHYWHEKKHKAVTYDFSQTLEIYGLFEGWLGMGLLADRLEEWIDLFGKEQLFYVHYEDIGDNPSGVYAELCKFYGIDPSFTPSTLTKKINITGPKRGLLPQTAHKVSQSLNMEDSSVAMHLSGKTEYLRGVEPDLYNKMLQIALPDIERMEKLLGTDLSHWKDRKE